jgi:hypothetical protein
LPHFKVNAPIPRHRVGGRNELGHGFPPEGEQVPDLLSFRIDDLEPLITIQENGFARLLRNKNLRNEAPCRCRARGLGDLGSER